MSLILSLITNAASDPLGTPGSAPVGWHSACACHLLSLKPSSAPHPAEPPAAGCCFSSQITAVHSQPGLAPC